MKKPRPVPAMMALLFFATASPALAQAPAPIPDDAIRLTPAQREAALEDGAERGSRELPLNGARLGSGVHGEVGFEISTRGERALYGATSVPLGNRGTASFSFLTSHMDGWRDR